MTAPSEGPTVLSMNGKTIHPKRLRERLRYDGAVLFLLAVQQPDLGGGVGVTDEYRR